MSREETKMQTNTRPENRHLSQNYHDETLCWTCRYSTGTPIPTFDADASKTPKTSNCPWACESRPVPEWSATPRTDTYQIHDCPYYKPDLWTEIDRLQGAVIAQILKILAKQVLRRGMLQLCKTILYRLIKKLSKKTNPDADITLSDITRDGEIDLHLLPAYKDETLRSTEIDIITEMMENNEDEASDYEQSADGACQRVISHLKSDTRRLKKLLYEIYDQE